MKRKIIGIILSLMLVITIIPLTSAYNSNPKIIYVDDDGGADFTNIQDAIDFAEEEDTIFVYGGTYNEMITIDKPLNLQGENKETTIIDGKKGEFNKDDVIYVNANKDII